MWKVEAKEKGNHTRSTTRILDTVPLGVLTVHTILHMTTYTPGFICSLLFSLHGE